MTGMACPNCGSSIEVDRERGLAPSYGGYDLFCVVCGHVWHVD